MAADGSVVIKVDAEAKKAEAELKRLNEELKNIQKEQANAQKVEATAAKAVEKANDDLLKKKQALAGAETNLNSLTERQKSIEESISPQMAANLDAEKAKLQEMKDLLQDLRSLPKKDERRGNISFVSDEVEGQRKRVQMLQREYDKVDKELENMPGKIAAATVEVQKQAAAVSGAESALKNANLDLQNAKDVSAGLAVNADNARRAVRDAAIAEKWFKQEAEEAEKKKHKIKYAVDQIKAALGKATSAMSKFVQHGEKAGKNAEKTKNSISKVKSETNNAASAMDRFTNRVAGLIKRAFIFTLISRALSGLRSYLGKALEKNEAFRKSVEQLKGTLLTAFQPLWEKIVPVLTAFITLLTRVASALADFTAKIFGTTRESAAAAAKATYDSVHATDDLSKSQKKADKQSKKLQKTLAGFDELNILSDESKDEDATDLLPEADKEGYGADFSTEGIEKEMSALEIFIAGALLALGAILTFTGANIPLGIALMAIGAIGLAQAVGLNPEKIVELLRGPIGAVTALVSIALLAVGAFLTFTGANLPLGIALIAAGAVGLVTVTALNWDKIVSALRGPIGKIVAIASAALLALGIVLALTGVAMPLGIALIAAGAVGLVTVTALNWDAILEKLKGAWDKIKTWWKNSVGKYFTLKYWKEKFSVIGQGMKAALNAVLAAIETAINWIANHNLLSFDIPDWVPGVGGKHFGIEFPEVHLPRLASGAVIPANREFLAVLGDQKRGTNVEAPAALIKQMVMEALSERGGSGDLYLTVQFGNEKIADKVIREINNRARGGSGVTVKV